MPEQRPCIIVTRRLPRAVEAALAERFDARLRTSDTQWSEQELATALRSADAVLCTLTDRLDAGVLRQGPFRARLLANFGAGTDHIDVGAAGAAGLVVTNTPGVLTECTADLTMALILMTLRRLGAGERLLRAGRWAGWTPTHHLGTRVTGKTLGIVGFGRIGQAVARRASHGFGMRVLVHSRSAPPAPALRAAGAEAVPLEALLGGSDVVSLHVPATPATKGLIDAGALGRMRPGAVLVNTARGELVDEAALVDSLERGHLGGAGLDVFVGEPRVSPALLAREDVVLLPHLGSATEETRTAMGMRALDNVLAFFAGREPADVVRA